MRSMFISVLSVLIMTAAALFAHACAAAENMFKITMIDVGKGDCILVQTGDEDDPLTVMIDTGYKETAGDVLGYLSEQNIRKIDVMIISHFHKDHVGGAAAILKGIPVGKVYMPDYEGTRKVYEEMMAILTDSGNTIPYERLSENLSFTLGDAEYTLYPSRIGFDGENDNDVSMAAALEYSGHTAFFAGDLEKDGIRQLFDNNDIPKKHYDILKLPHHGAQEKNTGDLLDRLKPGGITVITDGQDRRAWGVFLDALENDGFRAFCSADDGTITITADAEGYSVGHTKDPDDCSVSGDWKYVVLDDGSAAVTGYTGSETEITLPSEIEGHPVKSIGDSAFYNRKNLKRIVIPDSVESIGDSAFSWCTALTDITIPDSVKSIGDAAFSWCTALADITIPDSVKSIGESGFERCTALKNVKLSNGLTAVSASLFERCESLESIDIPDGVKTIGKDAFKRCISLKEVGIPESVSLIDEGAFKRCESLENIDIPEGVQSIESSAFERCVSLKSVKLPDSLTSLGKSAFQGCESLESAEIGKGLKTIKKSAFSGCVKLKTVDIPASVASIKEDAFLNCGSLKDIFFAGTTGQWEAVSKENNWSQGTPEDMVVHCSDPDTPTPTPDDPAPGPDTPTPTPDDPSPDPDTSTPTPDDPAPGPDTPTPAPDDPSPTPDDPEKHCRTRFFCMPELPATGFSAQRPKDLSVSPDAPRFQVSGFRLQIPSVDVSEEIVSVPFLNGEYPVDRLENNIGLPEEFAGPGFGSAVLVAHNHLSDAETGPFAFLWTLTENSRLFITDADNNLTLFSVFANVKIAADDMAAAEKLWAAYENTLILITCEYEKPEGGYASRRVIAARPVISQGS